MPDVDFSDTSRHWLVDMANLITYARAKRAIPNADATDAPTINAMIAAASAIIETYTHRKFIRDTFTERYDGTGLNSLFLDNFPVESVDWVATAQSNCLQIANTDTTNNQRAHVSVTDSGLRLTRVSAGSVATDVSVTWDDYATIGDVASAINSLGNGWSAAAEGEFSQWPSNELYAGQGSLNVIQRGRSQIAYLKVFDGFMDAELIDASCGQLKGWFPFGRQNILVRYTGGYTQSSLPADLQEACASLVAMLFDENTGENNSNSGMKREKLGDYEYERFQSPAAWPEKALAIVSAYVSLRF